MSSGRIDQVLKICLDQQGGQRSRMYTSEHSAVRIGSKLRQILAFDTPSPPPPLPVLLIFTMPAISIWPSWIWAVTPGVDVVLAPHSLPSVFPDQWRSPWTYSLGRTDQRWGYGSSWTWSGPDLRWATVNPGPDTHTYRSRYGLIKYKKVFFQCRSE
jgi:hypothetical protein